MNYKYIQRAVKTITYPIRLLALPLAFVIGVSFTDWEKESDRDFLWDTLKIFYKPW